MRRFLSLASIIGASALGSPALAVQPLQEFVQGAREHGVDAQEQKAVQQQQEAQADVAFGRALPGIGVRGIYTRNQYNAEIQFPVGGGPPQTITITPYDQLDAIGTLNVPIIDLASFRRISAARSAADASRIQSAAVALQVEAQVVQDYYQLLANQALVTASQRSVEVARASLEITQQRVQAGQAATLDADRATAEVERQVQQLASAQLGLALAARALESISGVAPQLGSEVPISDDLHPEPGLESFDPGAEGPPALASAKRLTLSANQSAQAQRLTLVPTLAGSFTERLTNAAGFVGHSSSFQAMLTLSWGLDYSTFANIRVQDAGAAIAQAREERTRLATRDAIHRAWNTVAASIARSRSARAQEQAARHAAELAGERYKVGASTQLDLLTAQRDAFAAEVGRIQADADVANARTQLQLAAGRDPFAAPGANP